jgi:hypothetical protein
MVKLIGMFCLDLKSIVYFYIWGLAFIHDYPDFAKYLIK